MLKRLVVLAVVGLAPAALAQSAADYVADAQTAYHADEPAECVRLYGLAFEQDEGTSKTYYDAACCAALAGRPAVAFAYLHDAIEAGYRNIEWLGRDSDLDALREDEAWPGVIAAAESAHEAFMASINRDLYELYEADQADRRTPPIDWTLVSRRDSLRRMAVGEMLLAGEIRTADDFYHAAMVYQHGESPESFLLANWLTREAVRLDSTHEPARQMVGMTHDRYLWHIDRPQVYGTQVRMAEDGLWTFEPFDPDAVTDEERANVGSLPLQAKYEWLEQRNAAIRAERESNREGPSTSEPAVTD